jgi:hypothetical protein
MNPKITKIDKEIEKTRGLITQGQARLRELEQKKTELEDTEIVAAFRASDIPLGELAAYLARFGGGSVLPKPGAPATTAPAAAEYPYTTTEEDNDIEA